MDAIVARFCNGSDVLGRDPNDVKIDGHYVGLWDAEWDSVVAYLSQLDIAAWQMEMRQQTPPT